MYLEMARDEAHGGGSWAFTNCVWAPSKTRNGRQWPFWTKVLDVRAGDIILHLRGITPLAQFVGYSIAASDGFETTKRPPDPGEWAYSESFFRADLEGYVPFHKPINLLDVFSHKRQQLEAYFEKNKSTAAEKLNLFYVPQSGRLQCLNGAYLSDVDERLFSVLFDTEISPGRLAEDNSPITVATGSQLATVKARLGQQRFADKIKDIYGNACCFPSCSVADSRFLVASHIARWSDNEKLRGHLGNGLCLCVVHDRAFELGLFTLDEKFCVFVSPKEAESQIPLIRDIREQHGKPIRLSRIPPIEDAILEHWIRVDLSP